MASFRIWLTTLALLLWTAGCTFWQNPQGASSGLHGLQGGEQVNSKPGLPSPAKAFAKLAPKTPVIPAGDPISLASKATPSANLHVATARMSEQAGNIAEAERHYQEALEADARHAGALVGYARLKDRQSKMDEAAALYRRAAKAHPKEASIANDLGLCLARQRKHAESIAAFEQAIRLDPKRLLYRNNIAMVLVEKGEIDAAVKQLTALQGEAVAHYNVGYILQKKGDSEAAAVHFTKALQKNPSLVEAGAWLRKLGKQPAAIADSAPRIAAGPQFDSQPARPPVLPVPAEQTGKVARTPATPFFPKSPASGEQKATVRPLPPLSGEPSKTYPRFDQILGGSPSAEPAPLPPPRSAGYTRVQPLPPVTAGKAGASAR
ncbi:MAG: tetratricopeptide repeat protein [Planctomycetota bacterium]